MKNKTAVDWLIEQFSKHYAIHQLEGEINTAKELEKQQIINAYSQNGWNDDDERADAEQYYKDTYEG